LNKRLPDALYVGKEQGLSGSDGAEVVAVAGRGSKHGVEVEWIACVYEGSCILLPCSTKDGHFLGTICSEIGCRCGQGGLGFVFG